MTSSRHRWLLGGLVLAILVGLIAGYTTTQKTINLAVDGHISTVRTHQRTVGGLLREVGISLRSSDTLSPSPDTILWNASSINIRHALLVTVDADGQHVSLYTQADTVADLLHEASLTLSPGDYLSVNGRVSAETSSLRQPTLSPATAGLPGSSASLMMAPSTGPDIAVTGASEPLGIGSATPASPIQIAVVRAVPIRLADGGAESTFLTRADTVGEALRQEGIPIYLADSVTPPLGTPVSPGILVIVQRALPVTIQVDGQTIHTRSQAQRVDQVLSEEGIVLADKDYSNPEPIAPLVSDMKVAVTRVREEIVTEEEAIPYNTIWQAAPDLELDARKIAQAGAEGVFKRRIHIVYENGVQTKRLLEREWVDSEPVTKVIAFGTNVVLHDAMTPDGPIQYWRKLRVYATWYNASHGYWDVGSRFWGMTRTGVQATKGIIAVDPVAVGLHTHVYVPGYGFGAAEDTGGAIKGMRVDLAFDEGDPGAHGLGWTWIYLLPPIPAGSQIAYILPDYPKEP